MRLSADFESAALDRKRLDRFEDGAGGHGVDVGLHSGVDDGSRSARSHASSDPGVRQVNVRSNLLKKCPSIDMEFRHDRAAKPRGGS